MTTDKKIPAAPQADDADIDAVETHAADDAARLADEKLFDQMADKAMATLGKRGAAEKSDADPPGDGAADSTTTAPADAGVAASGASKTDPKGAIEAAAAGKGAASATGAAAPAKDAAGAAEPTADELKTALAEALNTNKRLQGTVSGLHRKVDEVSKAAAKGGGGKPISLGKAKALLKDYAKEFPESAEFLDKFADALATDMRDESASKLDALAGTVQPVVEEAAKKSFETGRQQITAAHPDLDTIRKSPEFVAYVNETFPPGSLDHAGLTPHGTINLLSAYKAANPTKYPPVSSDSASQSKDGSALSAAPSEAEKLAASRAKKLATATTLETRPGSQATATGDTDEALFNSVADRTWAKHQAGLRPPNAPR